ncbi:uncharacterized protein LOC130673122 isoform X2 [Microplitis mediator]|nr:uncharacterized protein LOC130673122 isoform X2 [Microplitis mediator]
MDLSQLLWSKAKIPSEQQDAHQLLKKQRYHGNVGDKQSYWKHPVFATPAGYLGFDIPVTTSITLLSGFHRRLSKVLLYAEKDSVLVVPEKPEEVPTQVLMTAVPEVPISVHVAVGQHMQRVDTRLDIILTNEEWQAAVQKMAAELGPKTRRTVATQTVETRLTSAPHPGCLKCKQTGHSFDKCPNELQGDCYCTNCRRLGHTNNDCPYQRWRTEGYEAMRGYCRRCSTQYPFENDSCVDCRLRSQVTKAARGAYLILPP